LVESESINHCNLILNKGDIGLTKLNIMLDANSVKVLWRKGEKNSSQGGEIEREILRIKSVTWYEKTYWCILHITLLWYVLWSANSTRLVTRTKESGIITSISLFKAICVVKTNFPIRTRLVPCILYRRIVIMLGPERLWTILELVEARGNSGGRPRNNADVQIACLS